MIIDVMLFYDVLFEPHVIGFLPRGYHISDCTLIIQ